MLRTKSQVSIHSRENGFEVWDTGESYFIYSREEKFSAGKKSQIPSSKAECKGVMF
jgi:hypothetical protein